MGSFHKILALAEDLGATWESLPRTKWVKSAKVPEGTKKLISALDLQAVLLYRSFVKSLSVRDPVTSPVLSRTLFETSVAMAFAATENVDVAINKKEVRKPLPGDNVVRLDRYLRANMYLLHGLLDEQRIFGGPLGAKYFGPLPPLAPGTIDHYKSIVGPQWSEIISATKKYSGCKLSELCKILGGDLSDWYGFVYSLESRHSHSANALGLMTVDSVGNLDVSGVGSDEEMRAIAGIGMKVFFETCFSLIRASLPDSDECSTFFVLSKRYADEADG